ncbi:hypothetical protein KM92DES2_11151 [uncultured Desulfovibrio sp.]|uniref:Uncharacterized protein n=1 Tax=uncultured Desulfovibrio sp. TaxID=167968 RepID=A0A212JI07_9BACT|nr:hypothetical protein KM92DES2_11151 [uncultured Desulfovibrio sp.]
MFLRLPARYKSGLFFRLLDLNVYRR